MQKTNNWCRFSWLLVALSGFSMVAFGAMGAHGLSGKLTPNLMEAYNTAVRYQAWHTLAIMAVLAWQTSLGQGRALRLPIIFWFIGILLFSGSLYLIALLPITGIGIVTPIGGLFFMLGWLALGVSVLRLNTTP